MLMLGPPERGRQNKISRAQFEPNKHSFWFDNLYFGNCGGEVSHKGSGKIGI
jgi:hypothetical protein